MPDVEHNIAHQTSCLCPVCPVQVGSGCVNQKKEEGWIEMRGKVVGGVLEDYADHPETYDMPVDELKTAPVGQKRGVEKIKERDMIELYCSIGKSDCRDLETENPCVCSDCVVWETHSLSAYYFCLRGRARDIEREAA